MKLSWKLQTGQKKYREQSDMVNSLMESVALPKLTGIEEEIYETGLDRKCLAISDQLLVL